MSNIVPTGFGSTYLNPKIETYADLVYRVKSLLGWPSVPVEITDAQWAHIIDSAIETFTQFEGNRQEEYLVFCSNVYQRGCGVKLDELLNVGCNTQHCYQTVITETVTSTNLVCEDIQTSTAYLSVTPFEYPTVFDTFNPYSTQYSGTSGQNFHLYFDPKNPWSAPTVCGANCVTINPVSSQYFQLSANANLSGLHFDFINNPILSPILSSISSYYGDIDYSDLSLIDMGSGVSAIPISYFDLSAFYPDDILFGPPVEACINIGKGFGYVYPNCDTSKISACLPLSAQYNISPTISYILTSSLISSTVIEASSTDLSSVSAYYAAYCGDCNCNCQFVSSYSEDTETYDFSLISPYISSNGGYNWGLSSLDISDATHIRLYGVPSCTNDGSIPLNSNDGILATFTLCNTAFSTNGPLYLEHVQFFKDNKPPVEILYDQNCEWVNNGFTFSFYNSAYGNCVRHTPSKVKVDAVFKNCQSITEIGTVSSVVSSNIDLSINRKRKILGCFQVDTAGQGGYYGGGSDLLFNFDYALLANTFGYDLMGTRNNLGKQGYDLVTYHLARDFVDTSKKILRNVSYTFDAKSQYLKMTPEPAGAPYNVGVDCCESSQMAVGYASQCYIVGVYLEPPIETMLSTYFIKEYVLALAMILLGNIRSTFGGVVLYGGATLAGDQLVTRGEAKAEKLLEELRDQHRYSSPPGFFMM